MSCLDWENENGLVDGLIPKGVECPFKGECAFAILPSTETAACRRHKAMEKNFSCGAARFFSMLKGMKERKEKPL